MIAQQDARGALTLAQRVARDEGRVEGEIAGMRRALMGLLKARFHCEVDHRVEQCGELAQLERWLERAASADSLDSVFAEPS